MGTELVQCEANGNEMSLYYDTADDPSYAGGSQCTTPTWVFNKAITGDMNINETESENERTSRDPDIKYKQYMESMPELEVSGELILDTQYDGWRYLESMRYESYARNILALTQRISTVGAVGVKGKMRNFDRTKAGPQGGALGSQFKLRPAACVRAGCRIQPIQVAVANTAATYDPGVWTLSLGARIGQGLSAEPTLAERIVASAAMRGAYNTEPSPGEDDLYMYTDIGPVIQLLSVDEVDAMLSNLVEVVVPLPENPSPAARRLAIEPKGFGGFDVRSLLAAFREIIGNDPLTKDHKYMTPRFMKNTTSEFKDHPSFITRTTPIAPAAVASAPVVVKSPVVKPVDPAN